MKTQNKKTFKSKIIINNNFGFTITELVIVITILSILSIISFISFYNYVSMARDSKRAIDVENIQKGLNIFQVKSGVYPKPEKSFEIVGKDIGISYQGEIGENITRIINYSDIPLDPDLNTPYIYMTNVNKTKFQILMFMENK